MRQVQLARNAGWVDAEVVGPLLQTMPCGSGGAAAGRLLRHTGSGAAPARVGVEVA